MELVRSIWLSSSAVGGVCGARILVACGVGGLSNSTTVSSIGLGGWKDG